MTAVPSRTEARVTYTMHVDFGPNHPAVAAFIERARRFELYRNVGQPTEEDDRLVRVDFHFFAEHHAQPSGPWQGTLDRHEQAFERLINDHGRLTIADHLQDVFFRNPFEPLMSADAAEFFIELDEAFGDEDTGYYRDTHSYPQELYEDRILRILHGAAAELSVADLDPTLTFFQDLTVWIERGHVPAGWDGDPSDRKLRLW